MRSKKPSSASVVIAKELMASSVHDVALEVLRRKPGPHKRMLRSKACNVGWNNREEPSDDPIVEIIIRQQPYFPDRQRK
jgi:hypothetical protein